jgi:hypothetical protein
MDFFNENLATGQICLFTLKYRQECCNIIFPLQNVSTVIKTGLIGWRVVEIAIGFSSLARKLPGSEYLAGASFSETQRLTAYIFVPSYEALRDLTSPP